MRLVGGGAEALVPVGFVLGIVPFEPDDLAVAFEREDVRGDAVEEPTVVANHHGAAGEILQCLLECAHGVDIEIICRFDDRGRQDLSPNMHKRSHAH